MEWQIARCDPSTTWLRVLVSSWELLTSLTPHFTSDFRHSFALPRSHEIWCNRWRRTANLFLVHIITQTTSTRHSIFWRERCKQTRKCWSLNRLNNSHRACNENFISLSHRQMMSEIPEQLQQVVKCFFYFRSLHKNYSRQTHRERERGGKMTCLWFLKSGKLENVNSLNSIIDQWVRISSA